MNFSAFDAPFNQFAAKFNDPATTTIHHNVNHSIIGSSPGGAFSVPPLVSSAGQHDPGSTNRYNGNHFSQALASAHSVVTHSQHQSYGTTQYTQPASSSHLLSHNTDHQQNYHNFLNHSDTNKFYRKNHAHQQPYLPLKVEKDREEAVNQQILQNVNQSWPILNNNNVPSSSTNNDYSTHLLSAALPISLQHLLKYSENIKKETVNGGGNTNNGNLGLSDMSNGFNFNLKSGNLNLAAALAASGFNNNYAQQNPPDFTSLPVAAAPGAPTNKRVKSTKPRKTGSIRKQRERKKKVPKERKPRPKPGEIRETTALDGSKLYLCPECQMAYPDRSLIEQHIVSHAVERRFICDVCNAALKRKDHLTRHKLSHIPDRPHICNVCMKTFKRKEQLALHIIIHSGEKKHICVECQKGFYRKDHLRKHTRSHIARRVKSEIAQSDQSATADGNSFVASPIAISNCVQAVPVNGS